MSVYIIGPSLSGPVKIGKAADPHQRLRELQTGHHEKLHLLFYVDCGKVKSVNVENRAHKMKNHLRMHGEWFKMSGQDALQTVLAALRELGGKVSERERYEGPRQHLPFVEWLRLQEGREDPIGDLSEDLNRAGPIWPAENEGIEAICEAIRNRGAVEYKGHYCIIDREVVVPAVIEAWEEWSMRKAPANLINQDEDDEDQDE